MTDLIRKTFAPAIVSLGVSLGVALALALPGTAQAATYAFDKGHSRILFVWNHLGLSDQYGRFRDFDGTLMFDPAKPAEGSIEVTIEAGSLDTDVPDLNEHLRSADFFDYAEHPTITFKSTSVQQTAVDRGRVTGDLTIKGVTKTVTLDAKLNFTGPHPLGAFMEAYKGAEYAGFSATGEILRSDFGLGANAPMVSDRVKLILEVEMRKQ